VGSFVNIHIIGIHEEMPHCSQEKLISQKQYTVTQTLEPLSANCPNENHRKTTEKSRNRQHRQKREKYILNSVYTPAFVLVKLGKQIMQKLTKEKRKTEQSKLLFVRELN
jgi:hypothetical protein